MSISLSVPFFPNEVITEILSWLPVKPLLRFRCVCKFWKSLISDPCFVRLHLHRSSNNAHLILELHTPYVVVGRDGYNTLVSCSMRSILQNPSSINVPDDHLLLNRKYRVLGSCNGLLCLLASSRRGRVREYWVRFWNPEMNLKSENSPSLSVDLGDNFPIFAKFGYGYDKSSDTYKVVALFNDDPEDLRITRVKVYTMGDHCWRDIQPFHALPQNDEGNFLSGTSTLNWLASPDYVFSHEQLTIVSLDLGKETYRQFLLPVSFSESYNETCVVLPTIGVLGVQPTIGVLGDCLCLSHDYKRTHFVVWQMKEFGVEKSWTQVVNVCYQHLYIPGQIKFSSLVPLCISENGDVLVLLHRLSEIIIYNRIDKRVERAKIRNNRVWAKDHVQSLIMPGSN